MLFENLTFEKGKDIQGVCEGADFLVLLDAFQSHQGDLVYVGKNEQQVRLLYETLRYLCPNESIWVMPSWDCVPYDRVSPRRDIQAERAYLLGYLAQKQQNPQTARVIILTTPSAYLQKLPAPNFYQNTLIELKVGMDVDFEQLLEKLLNKGFQRVTSVHEPGEFAVRGGLLDLFAPRFENPVRMDFFGDHIERMRFFDPISQRSLNEVASIVLSQGSEFPQTPENLSSLATKYRAYFAHHMGKDLLYQQLLQGHGFPGLEHYMPLVYGDMVSLDQYLNNPQVFLAQGFDGALKDRLDHIKDHYETRLSLENTSEAYHPIEPQLLYRDNFQRIHEMAFDVFEKTQGSGLGVRTIAWQGLIADRLQQLKNLQSLKKSIHIFCSSPAIEERLKTLFYESDFLKFQKVEGFEEGVSAKLVQIHLASIDHSFETPHHIFISAQELLNLARKMEVRKPRRADLLIHEATALEVGDYLVHEEHGIGRFEGLLTLEIQGAQHDCFQLTYAAGDKLFVPVENSDVLTRFGGEGAEVVLDRLGSAAWQSRKAKIKNRLREIAQHLIDLAAARKLLEAPTFDVVHGDLRSFEDSFPYEETEDQHRAIGDVYEDLSSGKPMDRLICGDVGFGKTEVAIRAAFVAASQGKQVAVITPTTLLCRQHFKNFYERLTPFGLQVAQLSRFVSSKDGKSVKEKLHKGGVDVVIGTHSLLSKDLTFLDLGLVVVDEEQHFGVKQKEKLKSLQKDVHLLSLSATPIPRTLQMALSGVRDMSIIATSPVDRLAVRTFITPFDALVVKEAIERELHRQGQVFYVCPRLKDIPEVKEKLLKLMPGLRIAVATGQMAAHDLEDVMDAFMNREYDLLLATNIIESGIDIASVNTLFVHKSDLFGLSQLYQLRGRIGRGKVRGYAYFLLPDGVLSQNAQKRLEVMQSLDSLGAGFQLASYDMDIRGAGNLLGDEQSGHVREVGIELYQQMLEEAVESLKTMGQVQELKWQAEINLPIPILIPEDYVKDLSLRLSLYRRLSRMGESTSLDDFQDELIDRFGSLPEATANLIHVMHLKLLCHKAHIERIDVGDKGCVVTFHQNTFPKPEALVNYCMANGATVRLRPDQKLVFTKVWPQNHEKIQGLYRVLDSLVSLLDA